MQIQNPNITQIENLTGVGFIKASASVLSVDNNTYLTGNQNITLSGEVSGSGTISIVTTLASASVWNAKQNAFSSGSLTETTSSVLTITGGTNAVIGSGVTIAVQKASASTSGYLSSDDWTIFNAKQSALANPITGTGIDGQIAVFNDTTTLTSVASGSAFNKAFETSTGNIKMDGSISVGVLSTIPRSDHIHPSDTSREPAIATGSIAQYWRGDKTWQTTPTGTVTSVSIVNANGVSGSVVNPTTTPAITLTLASASVWDAKQNALNGTGFVKAAGTVISYDNSTYNTGSVTSVSIVNANGCSGSVATATTTPAITLTLGAITPSSVASTGLVSGTNIQTSGSVLLPSVHSGDHSTSGLTIPLTAGVAVAFGDVGRISSNGNVLLAKADAIANCGAVVMCADATISSGSSGNWLLNGIARHDAWSWTVGSNNLIYINTTGTTTNTLTQTAPSGSNNVIQVVGIPTAATRLYFNPQLVMVEHT